jgi:RNA polymerase sigma factor (TIGR02999 family)
MDEPVRREITAWIADLAGGDREALDRLFEALYGELRDLAHRQLSRGRPGETLSTTALVHEAYMKLARAGELAAVDRHHFFSLAARVMRQVLIDEARRRTAARRPDPSRARPLEDVDGFAAGADLADLLAIDAALGRLEKLDPELGRLVESRVFAGLTLEEIAEIGAISRSTVQRNWRKARAFLHRELAPAGEP